MCTAVYCELPNEEMLSHVRFLFDGKDGSKVNAADTKQKRALYMMNCAEFLRSSYGRIRRICPVNAMYYQFNSEEELKQFAITLAQQVNRYRLEGLILSDYRIAVLLHALLPELEIHTSCNGYQWNLRQMEIWREQCGAQVFNPPREILRTPTKLKEMHAAGFRLKCLICYAGFLSCCQNGIADLFRSNWILPRWQKYFDEYVDIYKIAGRNSEGDYPFKTMDAYLTEKNDMVLTDLMISGTVSFARRMTPPEAMQKVTLDKVPDKLLLSKSG